MKCIRLNQIKLPLTHSKEELEAKILKMMKIKREQMLHYEIVKRSVDAREKPDIKYVYSLDVFLKQPEKFKSSNKNIALMEYKKYEFAPTGTKELKHRPVIVGLGPAGLFCGYYLAKYGYQPIILERGEDVDARTDTVERFWQEGILDTESNVQFGEGGAGTFSDGKLNTLVKDKSGRNREVLERLVEFGAKKEICYVNKPHIGTDVLKSVVKNMRQEIIRLGGEIHFQTKMTEIVTEEVENQKKITGICINGKEKIDTEVLVLAIGHSARDTFEMLDEQGVWMQPKAFAVGLRIEHKQSMINRAMYGVDAHELLEAADYKVTYNTDTHGIYSFCMCPGGYVVNASSEMGRLAVNGMSYSDRAGENSNSAIVVTVSPKDYQAECALDGIRFQRELEEAAYREGGGNIPVQRFADFCANIKTEEFGDIKPCMKGAYQKANLRNVLPDELSEQIIEGIHGFHKNIREFDDADALLSGVESRTSSPVRMERTDDFTSVTVDGVYPCGEGAGYAGGITSAAMDGIRVFEAIASQYTAIKS